MTLRLPRVLLDRDLTVRKAFDWTALVFACSSPAGCNGACDMSKLLHSDAALDMPVPSLGHWPARCPSMQAEPSCLIRSLNSDLNRARMHIALSCSYAFCSPAGYESIAHVSAQSTI